MTEPARTTSRAWLPLTPRGVASFAFARLRWLLVVEAIVALIAAATVFWFVDWAWYPTIGFAIRQLPARGEIRSGKLNIETNAPQLLAEGHFLAFVIDPRHSGEVRSPAQFQVELGETSVRVISLLGYTEFDYPKGSIIAFNRAGVEPWWGAWKLPLRCMTGAAAFLCILTSWILLGSVYCLPVWLAGFFANRELKLGATWKLAEAALMPGALVMIAGIVLYGLGVLDLVRFVAVTAMHFAVGWLYCFVSLLFVPKLNSPDVASHGNPFVGSDANQPTSRSKARNDESNPGG